MYVGGNDLVERKKRMTQEWDKKMGGPKSLRGNEIQTMMDMLTFESSKNNYSILTERR